MKILSPITLSKNVRVEVIIPKEVVIKKYNDDLGVDVSRFFTDIQSVKIYKCLDTGYMFYHPLNIWGDEAFYDELKIQLPAKYNSPYYSNWKWEYGVCVDLINLTDKVFEIGCGFGSFLLKLKERGVLTVGGLELNKASVIDCLQKGLDVEYGTIQDKAGTTNEQFDAVCSFQVLEHIAEVKSFLIASLKILKKGGHLIIAVPFNDPFLFTNDKYNTLNMPPHHMGLWGKQAFENLVKYFPVELEQIIIEKLPASGYDFDQYYAINKDSNYSATLPFKKIYDRLYLNWLRKNHSKKNGKNIIAVFRKKG